MSNTKTCYARRYIGKRKGGRTIDYSPSAFEWRDKSYGALGYIERMYRLSQNVESFSSIEVTAFVNWLNEHVVDRELFDCLKPILLDREGFEDLMYYNWRVGYIELSLGIWKFGGRNCTRDEIFEDIDYFKESLGIN